MALSQAEIQQINELITNRIRNLFSRGEIKKITPGKTSKAKVELLSGEIFDGIELPNQFGFQSNPPVGSEAIAMFFGGNRDHGSVSTTFNKEHTQQEDLDEGESIVFDATGSKIYLKADGSILLVPSGGTVNITGNLVVSGDVSDAKGSMQEMRDDYNPHTHGGGPTPLPQMT